MKRFKGINLFITEPGEQKRFYCQVCGSKCKVLRDQYAYTSMLSAMAKKKTRHDEHICPRTDEKWHEKAVGLIGISIWFPAIEEKKDLLEKLNNILSENGCETFNDKI